MPPTAAVIIPHHQGKAHLRPLFKSLLRMDDAGVDVELMLWDNNSNDGSRELVQRKFKDVRIEGAGENLGFAPAINQAAQRSGADWLIVLNNDIHVAKDWLAQLIEAQRITQADCLSSHLLSWDGKRTQFAGGWINAFGKGFEQDEPDSLDPYEIFFPCGCGMMIRRELFLDAGGFDDAYFMIYEDVDLGWRLRLFGHEVWLAPNARVFHRGHASLDAVDFTAKAVYLERNSLATIYKNYDAANQTGIIPAALQDAARRAQSVAGAGLPYRHSSDGTAILRGIRAFIDQMPHWRERRHAVQSRRKVSDDEILERFFPAPRQTWAYTSEHYRRLAHPDAAERLNAIHKTLPV